jgi:hypothetical protein
MPTLHGALLLLYFLSPRSRRRVHVNVNMYTQHTFLFVWFVLDLIRHSDGRDHHHEHRKIL